MYTGAMYTIYNFARVISVDLDLTIVNTHSDPIRVAVCKLPNSDVSGVTYTEASQMPDAWSTLLSTQGGLDKIVYRKRFVAQVAYGNPLSDHSYWVNSTQAASTTPLHADDFVIGVFSDGLSVSSTATAIAKITYHCEFFDLQYAVA